VSELPEVRALLASLDLPADDGELVLRRTVSAAGKSRCSVNGSLVPLAHLKRLGDLLADLHGQHEHQLLLDPAHHLACVDAFGGLGEAREGVARAHAAWREAAAALQAARAARQGRAERLDLLRYQIQELETAALRSGEAAELRAERERLAHAARLQEALAAAREALGGEGGAGDRLGGALAALRTVEAFDRERIGPVLEALGALADQIRERSADLRGLAERIPDDPAALERITERLDLVERLSRKYGGSEAAALERLAAARAEVRDLESGEETVAALERRLEEARAELSARAVALSADRARAAERLAARVARELRELAMSGADLGVRITQTAAADGPVEQEGARYAATADGIDRVEFYLAPNVGEGTRPLKAVASGGELSRIMLALKAVLASTDRVGTLVFDEIDAGIGGRVAEVVGRKLKAIAAERQVLCITHLPQIAAKAERHLVVRKLVERGHTRAVVASLGAKERIRELARMVAGEEITPTALRHAEAMLGEP
jgi:DNA repair protein RecN (Recombination protein N)